jgi:hypothetical protein
MYVTLDAKRSLFSVLEHRTAVFLFICLRCLRNRRISGHSHYYAIGL